MTVLITGGGGFLGAWIIKRLHTRGIEVRVLDLSDDRSTTREIIGSKADGLDWRRGDVASSNDVTKASRGCDFVIHLAALLTPACIENPILGAQVNLIGTLNVFEAAKTNGLSGVTYASSAAVFGPDAGETPCPTTHYGAYKLACEGAARAYWLEAGVPSVGYRPLVVYGPGRDIGLTAGPSIACRKAAQGKPYTIGFSGATDMIFVDDVAAAFEAAVVQPFKGAHAFSLVGEMVEVADIAAAIEKVAPNSEISFEGPPIPVHPNIIPGAVEKLLGTLPHTSLTEGIRRTVTHYQVDCYD